MAIANGFQPALQLLEGREDSYRYRRIMRKYGKAALAADEDQKKLERKTTQEIQQQTEQRQSADYQRTSVQAKLEAFIEKPCPILMDLVDLSDGVTRCFDCDFAEHAWENFNRAISVVDIEKAGVASQVAAKQAVDKLIAKTHGLSLAEGAHLGTHWNDEL
jgi:hypothetical protein